MIKETTLNEEKEKLSKKLKELRRKEGLTLKKIAKFTKIKYSTYLTYENGSHYPSLENLGKIAKFYSITLEELVGKTTRPNSKVKVSFSKEMPLGDRLKNLRKNDGYTQMEVAEILDVKRGTYIAYEYGKCNPRIHILLKLCDLYALNISELIL